MQENPIFSEFNKRIMQGIIVDCTLFLHNKLSPYGIIQALDELAPELNHDELLIFGGYNLWSPELYELCQALSSLNGNIEGYRIVGQRLDSEEDKYKLLLHNSNLQEDILLNLCLGRLRFVNPLTSGIKIVEENGHIRDALDSNFYVAKLRFPETRKMIMCLTFPLLPEQIGKNSDPEVKAFDLLTKRLLEVEYEEKSDAWADLKNEYVMCSQN